MTFQECPDHHSSYYMNPMEASVSRESDWYLDEAACIWLPNSLHGLQNPYLEKMAAYACDNSNNVNAWSVAYNYAME